MSTLQCNAALSDLVLQAARSVMPRNAEDHTLGPIGRRNQQLVPLLVALLNSATVTANAIGDNAFEDCLPLPLDIAQQLAAQCRRLAENIENASQSPDRNSWILPAPALSMTREELI